MTDLFTPLRRPQVNSDDTAQWVVVAVLAVIGLIALVLARQLLAPIDDLITSQACTAHGDQLSRPVDDYQRSNRFGLVGRTHGWCQFGPVEEPEADRAGAAPDQTAEEILTEAVEAGVLGATADQGSELRLGLDEMDPGALYRWLKVMGVVLQLGFVSFVVRFVGEPLLDRFVRSRR